MTAKTKTTERFLDIGETTPATELPVDLTLPSLAGARSKRRMARAPGSDATPAPAKAAKAPRAPKEAKEPRVTKAAKVLELLEREQGATLTEIMAWTGWLPHTTRAFLSGLRKKGTELAKGANAEGVTTYTAAKAA